MGAKRSGNGGEEAVTKLYEGKQSGGANFEQRIAADYENARVSDAQLKKMRYI